MMKCAFKDKVELWSWDCIVKETLWNLSKKVDHLAYTGVVFMCFARF